MTDATDSAISSLDVSPLTSVRPRILAVAIYSERLLTRVCLEGVITCRLISSIDRRYAVHRDTWRAHRLFAVAYRIGVRDKKFFR